MITKAIMAAQGSLQDARELGIFEHWFKDYVPRRCRFEQGLEQ